MKTRLLLVLVTLPVLTACGYKSGLYLPEADANTVKAPAVVTPAPFPDRPQPAEAVPPPQ